MTATRGSAAAVALAVVAALALLLPGLGTAPFDDPGEGQHAEIAREAWADGDWLTLRLNGVPYYDKPPLLYALAAAAFALWGPGEWAARLGPALGAALAVAATALCGARLLGPFAGFLAGAALLSCALFAAFARYVRPETLFVAAIQLGFTGLLLGLPERSRAPAVAEGPRASPRARRGWQLLGCAALGAASLAKDPLGLLGPPAAVAIALALGRRLTPVSRWLPRAGLAVLAALGLGWYALAAARNPGFLWYAVVDNHLLNAVRLRRFPDEDVPLSSVEFLATAALGAFPWIIPAALMAGALLRRRAWRIPGETAWVALSLWAAGVVALFTVLPFRLPHYGLPAYPAVALLAARWWNEREPGSRRPIALHLGAFAGVAALSALAAASDGRAFTEAVLGASDVTARKAAVLGEPLSAPAWASLRPLLGGSALLFGAGAGALGLCLLRPSRRLGPTVVLATMLASLPLVAAGLGLVASARALPGMAAEVRARVGPDELLVHEGPIEQSGAIEFYSGRRPVLLDGTRSVLGFGATLPASAPVFWNAERFRREWAAERRVWLLTPRTPVRSVVASLPAGRLSLVLAHNGRRLYTNLPPGARAGGS